jgi:hypothetical protein
MAIRTLGLPTMLTRLFGYFFFGILVLVLLPMVNDYFNGCVCACSCGIAPQIKIMEYLHVYFFGCVQKIQDYVMKEERA